MDIHTTKNDDRLQQDRIDKSSNGQGCQKRESKKSAYKGVTFYKRTGRWEAYIWHRQKEEKKGKQYHLGSFNTELRAARAYDLALIWGNRRRLRTNLPIESYNDDPLLAEMRLSNPPFSSFVATLKDRCGCKKIVRRGDRQRSKKHSSSSVDSIHVPDQGKNNVDNHYIPAGCIQDTETYEKLSASSDGSDTGLSLDDFAASMDLDDGIFSDDLISLLADPDLGTHFYDLDSIPSVEFTWE